ncbi:MAG: hypothetical protein AAFP00_11095, partial [Bacteroidota bacterium]
MRDHCFALAGFYAILTLALMLLGLLGVVLYPTIPATSWVPKIIENLLPVGVKGLAMTGIIMANMSTLDSYIHAAGLTLTHDLIKPICDTNEIKVDELRCARYTTFLIGLIAIAIGFTKKADDLYGFVFTSFEFTGPLLALPLLTGIMGLKPDQRAFYIAASVTLVAFIGSNLFLPETWNHFSVLISVVANGLTFFGTHFVLNNGFLLINHERKLTKAHLWKPNSKKALELVKETLFTPSRIIAYSQRKVECYGAPYILFGAFCYINFIVPYFMWNHESVTTYNLMLYLRLVGATLCALLIVQEKWPDFLLPFFPTFWHFTLLYCIPFTSTVMFLLTQGSTEWLINVAITIMFLIVLVDWMSFVILTALGIGLGFYFFTQVIGPINIQLDFSSGYLLVYQGLFATLIGLLFARRKQQRFDELANHNQALTLADQENKEKLLEAVRERVRIIQTLKHAGIQDL